jgi:hypothetical protein
LQRVGKKERLRLGRLEHNTTQFSHGRKVLRSSGLNHVNHRVHRIHVELTTRRLKAFPTKEPHQAALERLQWKCCKTTSIFGVSGRRVGVSLEARLLLLRVVVPAMIWWLHSIRLKVAAVQQ